MRLILFLFCVLPLSMLAQKKSSAKKKTDVKLPADVEAVFDSVQRQTFRYFWEGAEPVSGLARERVHMDGDYPEKDQSVVTIGGSGFGIMAILSGIHRGYITREEGFKRLKHIADYLEKADRFHGAWPHWLHGETGKVKPFGYDDDGGDLVESSFLITSLLCVRQYFADGNAAEKALAARMDKLWREVDFNWYRRGGQNVLYWHWSPKYEWKKNFAVRGYNECLIMYVLAASSPTHGVPAEVYHQGWADNGRIMHKREVMGHELQLLHQGPAPNGGPLFWAHYSWLGLDPRALKDKYADYWKENRNQSLINYEWCVKNPKKCAGYGPNNWGLTASYSVKGYAAHEPSDRSDYCVISPTAALSSMPYTPEQSQAAMMNWYRDMKDKVWGAYGFYDAFSQAENWYPQRYLAIDQGPIVVMMENYRSGLLWDLFMSCAEIQAGLKKLGFTINR
ncbi:glucoamylase family protein [Pollutibacter soli]|uniref:glucoamylase family protein n=1 Tax=Pollutibacter soli TaxID=3034157 RepID=UPI0030136C3B